MKSPVPPATSIPEVPAPDRSTSTRPQCKSLTKNGEPCRAVGVVGDYCLAHDPERREVQERAWSAGGQHNSRKWKTLEALSQHPTLHSVIETLNRVMAGVEAGEVPPATGNSIASLSRSMVAAIMAAADTSKVRELETLLDQVSSEKPRLRAVP